MQFLVSLAQASIKLFIIIDPIGLIPIFMALTHDLTPAERRSVFSKAAFVALLLLLLFTFTGTGILYLFNISLADFQIAGGILLMVIALNITLQAHYGQSEGGGAGIVPLAVPLLVGPGAITTTIVLIGTDGLAITFTAVVINFLVAFIIYRYVGIFYRYLGQTGSDVVAKIMGMLLAAIAVQFIRQGLTDIIHHM